MFCHRNELWSLRSRYNYHYHDQEQQQPRHHHHQHDQLPAASSDEDLFIARMEAQLNQTIDETAPSPTAFQLAPIPTMEEIEWARQALASATGQPNVLSDMQLDIESGSYLTGALSQPKLSSLKAVRVNRPRVTFGENRVKLIPDRHEEAANRRAEWAQMKLATRTDMEAREMPNECALQPYDTKPKHGLALIASAMRASVRRRPAGPGPPSPSAHSEKKLEYGETGPQAPARHSLRHCQVFQCTRLGEIHAIYSSRTETRKTSACCQPVVITMRCVRRSLATCAPPSRAHGLYAAVGRLRPRFNVTTLDVVARSASSLLPPAPYNLRVAVDGIFDFCPKPKLNATSI